ncbi:MAG: hypothetical protein FJ095_07260 [Deltaproteobacteria bacterium]|nr:hypothetical protein [Deltaproteobacteria bacterium]
MKKEAMAVVGWTVAFFSASGCSNKLEDAQCEVLRGQAFEVINSAHVCADDADCVPTNWPGCAKPVSSKNKARVLEFKEKFDQGKCVEAKATCRDTPEIYCKQGLCVFRELAGQTNPTK